MQNQQNALVTTRSKQATFYHRNMISVLVFSKRRSERDKIKAYNKQEKTIRVVKNALELKGEKLIKCHFSKFLYKLYVHNQCSSYFKYLKSVNSRNNSSFSEY